MNTRSLKLLLVLMAPVVSIAAARPTGTTPQSPTPQPSTPVDIVDALDFEEAFPNELNDATIRRTDPVTGVNPIPVGRVIPDLLAVSITPWITDFPNGDVYEGQKAGPGDPQDLLRLDIVFKGLLNPPGPLGVNALAFEPDRFGQSPVYGIVEIDIDDDIDTGGVVGGAAEIRYLGNVARFGALPEAPLTGRAARSGGAYDLDFYTPPFFERTGADWEFILCGCRPLDFVSEIEGDGDMIFEAGESWILEGRVFQRSPGFQLGSIAFGGSQPGLYDPVVQIRFFHHDDPVSSTQDRTIVSLVYPLTMSGAAILGETGAEAINSNVADQTSIEEGLADIIEGAESGALFGENLILQEDWAGAPVNTMLDPGGWRSTALFGTSYPDTRPYLYIWTDVGFPTLGDLDGDADTDCDDQTEIADTITLLDGTGRDADGAQNGVVDIPNFGPNFWADDINGDGMIDGDDLYHALYDPPPTPGDVNGDDVVDFSDLNIILANWGRMDEMVSRPDGDLDDNGVVDFSDLNQVLAFWGTVYPTACTPPAPPGGTGA
ncbi:MAG: hypothetical protein RIB32_02785 [Phycisphaerales bacterium]